MRKLLLACALASVPSLAGAFSYSEVVDGDLSGNFAAPTALVAAVGSNTLSGTTVGGDLEYLRITLPDGYARVRANPTFAALPIVALLDQGSIPAGADMVVGQFVGDAAADLVFVSENVADGVAVAGGDGAGRPPRPRHWGRGPRLVVHPWCAPVPASRRRPPAPWPSTPPLPVTGVRSRRSGGQPGASRP